MNFTKFLRDKIFMSLNKKTLDLSKITEVDFRAMSHLQGLLGENDMKNPQSTFISAIKFFKI